MPYTNVSVCHCCPSALNDWNPNGKVLLGEYYKVAWLAVKMKSCDSIWLTGEWLKLKGVFAYCVGPAIDRHYHVDYSQFGIS